MFRSKIRSDIREKIESSLEKAKEELDINFSVEDIVIYGSVINKESPNDIDIFLELKIDLDSSNEEYQDFSFDEYDSNFYDGEIKAKNEIHKFLHGDMIGFSQPEYQGKKLDLNVELGDFEEYGFSSVDNDQFEEIDDFLRSNEGMRKVQQYKVMQKESAESNLYNNPEAKDKFIELANGQRGKPEIYMVKLQGFMGGGVMNPMIEHIGDLTHRMSQRIYVESGDVTDSIKDIYPKLERGLRTLKHGYGFEREFEENIVVNFEYTYDEETKKMETVDQYREEIIKRLEEYSRLHSELKVYNQAQYYAREAAINVGKINVPKAIHCLEKLKDMIDNEEFFMEASKYDPDFELKFKPDVVTLYHGSNEYFQEVDPARLGEKITSLGRGFYLTPNYEKAKSYGDKIMEFNVDMQDVLDWGNLTIPQRLRIEKALLEVVPEERIAGFGEKVEVTVPANEEGIVKYKELKHKTKHYYHEAARAQTTYNEDDTITISYRKASNLKLANNQQLMTLMNEYRPELAKELGFKCAKFSDEISVYDLSLVKYNSVLEDNIKNTIAKKKKVLSSQKIGNP